MKVVIAILLIIIIFLLISINHFLQDTVDVRLVNIQNFLEVIKDR